MRTTLRKPGRNREITCVIPEPLERRVMLAAVPEGPEFQVNTYTTGSQSDPAVAMDASGNFAVVWTSQDQDGSLDGIFAQRYDASGVPQGDEFRVNTYTTSWQARPAVAMDADGDFVIVWDSHFQDGSGVGVYAQRYNAAGVPQGDEFQVNTYSFDNQAHPAVAMNGAGDFVVAWQSFLQDGHAYGVYAQRYNAAGEPQGDEFRVNTYTTNSQREPAIAMDADGNFVVTWESRSQDGGGGTFGSGIYAQRYNAAGVAQGDEFRVNVYTTNDQNEPAIAMDADGDFVVTWTSRSQPGGSTLSVYARRYDAAGVPQGGEFRVNTFTGGVAGAQHYSRIAMDAAGNFTVTWTSSVQDGSLGGIYAQCYNAAGVRQGIEYRVNTYTTGSQYASDIAMSADGDFVIAWHDNGQDGSGFGVFAQRYEPAVPPTVSESSFLFETAPHRLSFAFDQNVGASLQTSDLLVRDIVTQAGIIVTNVSWDSATNMATFTLNNVLPDANYRATLIGSGITGPGGLPMAADHTFDFFFLTGDANRDGRVNLADFNILAANFGQSGRTFSQGNFDYDPAGNVNLADFNKLAGRFGVVLGATVAGGSLFGEERESWKQSEEDRVADGVLGSEGE